MSVRKMAEDILQEILGNAELDYRIRGIPDHYNEAFVDEWSFYNHENLVNIIAEDLKKILDIYGEGDEYRRLLKEEED